MLDVLKDGFLDGRLNEMIENFRIKYKRYYEIIYQCNELAFKIRKKFNDYDATSSEMYVFTNFIQIHNSFQAYIILMERGMVDDSYIILRTMYEKLIKQQTIIKDEKEYANIVQEHYIKRRSMCKYILDNNLFDSIDNKALAETIKKCDERILKDEKGKKIKPKSTEKMAETNGMEREYFSFKFLSMNVHNDLQNISNMYKEDDGGIYIDGGFRFEDVKIQIIRGLDCLLKSMNIIIEYLQIEQYKIEISKISSSVNEL